MAERNGFPMRHLGDGVYASFDGYQIWLHVNSHENPPVVAIEQGVLHQMMKYWVDVHTTPEPRTVPEELVGEERDAWLKANGY